MESGKGSSRLKMNIRGHELHLHYHKKGNGSEVLLTFHGFGQSSEAMFPIGESMDCVSYHFDIFYHGRSFWPSELGPLTPDLWSEILNRFLEYEDIDRFSLAGFSMGGKFVLATITKLAHRIDQVILLAPDGIQTSTWYNLANYPLFFRPYFRSMIVKPWRFYNLIRVVEKTGLLDKGLSKFASLHMDTRKKRRRVYYSWVIFKPLSFSLKEVAECIKKEKIKLIIFTGKFDKIITSEGMGRLLRHVPDGKLIEVESGHNQLISKASRYISKKEI